MVCLYRSDLEDLRTLLGLRFYECNEWILLVLSTVVLLRYINLLTYFSPVAFPALRYNSRLVSSSNCLRLHLEFLV